MRAFALIITVGTALAFSVLYPFVGYLVWEWLNLMSPHELTFGSLTSYNLIQWVALATIISWLFSKERKVPDIDTYFVVMVTFLIWLFVSQWFSLVPEVSQEFYDRFLRVLAFGVLGLVLIDSKLRIQAALWVFVLSISFYGVKGGLFTILSGGSYHVFGAPNSIIENNNHLGLALACTIPLVVHLYRTTRDLWIKRALAVAGVLNFVAILGTQSRGAFVALLAMAALLWWRSQRKVPALVAAVVILLPALLFMPDTWSDRMSTIQSVEEDASFQGRVDAWAINWSAAKEYPFTGAGLRVLYGQEIASQFTETPRKSRAAHSIYFEVLGGMGFVGFLLFTTLLAKSQTSLWRLRKQLQSSGSDSWSLNLASALQISLVAFMVGGVVQSMEMWEGFWLMIALTAGLEKVTREKIT